MNKKKYKYKYIHTHTYIFSRPISFLLTTPCKQNKSTSSSPSLFSSPSTPLSLLLLLSHILLTKQYLHLFSSSPSPISRTAHQCRSKRSSSSSTAPAARPRKRASELRPGPRRHRRCRLCWFIHSGESEPQRPRSTRDDGPPAYLLVCLRTLPRALRVPLL